MATFEQFAFQIPLYTKLELPDDLELKALFCGYNVKKVDGFCPECGKISTFTLYNNTKVTMANRESPTFKQVSGSEGYNSLEISCARNHSHKIRFWFYLGERSVVKVGQDPSLADIANDEAATYRNVLNKETAAELHKAIGLAAHGVGIGSFVYLRRVFERLVYGRFNEFKQAEGWKDEDFFNLKMDDKVKFLKGHIPDFLYENRKIYGVLSKGIHELSEDVCLRVFEPLKLSIKIILEEDQKKKDELALRQKTAEAIKAIDLG